MGKSRPEPPQPVVVNAPATASTQAAFNRDAAVDQRNLNNVDQFSPQGNVQFEGIEDEFSSAWEGGPGRENYGKYDENAGQVNAAGNPLAESFVDAPIQRFKVTQTLAPEQQALFDSSNRVSQQYADTAESQLGQVTNTLQDPFTLAGLGAAPTFDEAGRQRSLDAILARHNPQADRQRAALETSLTNQGFITGSQGFDDAFDQFNRSETDFGLAADISAGNEAARDFGLASSARDREINEILMQRNQPLSELATLSSGSQPQGPQFLNTPQGQIAAPDFQGAAFASANQANAGANQAYQGNLSAYNTNLQGLYGLGGAAAGAGGYAYGKSDRRLKENIEKVGQLENGLPIYAYNFKGKPERQMGLMADEVAQVHPNAVVMESDGYYAVNYLEAVK
tara:strand:+ start:2868 stop:4055 length:1188 start_codon:yes stop_codon:yes gene_type:complete